ncbi:hypothetical protein D917_01949 [Trichinella nativa]|uniref:non-specific serine/threonine protein kinase n=1 Tax=Trichinella nativa TaxID=6335 RepID=A0A1Y3EJG7_9BILA|nr:hypothetical protein D917_01949 [Trichinella nativa]
MSSDSSDCEIDDVLDGWIVEKFLGRGAFGCVYQVVHEKTKQKEAMKIEKRLFGYDKLFFEIEVMKKLETFGAKRCCKCIAYGENRHFRYVVMTLMGMSVSEVLKSCENSLSIYEAMYIGMESLHAIEELHNVGFLHQDIKPQNFVFGLHSNSHILHIIDFGSAASFLLEDGSHRPKDDKKGFTGSYLYASAYAMSHSTLSRNDDIWSWFFMLIKLTVGKLPWTKLRGNSYAHTLLLNQQSKYHYMANPVEFLTDCPICYFKIMETVEEENFFAVPEYNAIQSILKEAMNAWTGKKSLRWLA